MLLRLEARMMATALAALQRTCRQMPKNLGQRTAKEEPDEQSHVKGIRPPTLNMQPQLQVLALPQSCQGRAELELELELELKLLSVGGSGVVAGEYA